MKKYFVLYKASPAQFKRWMNMPKEAQKKGMQDWNKWMKDHKKDIADSGTPLSKVKKVTSKKVTNSHNDIGGYMILKAKSHDAAAKIMRSSPHFDELENGSWIEVMEMPEWKNLG